MKENVLSNVLRETCFDVNLFYVIVLNLLCMFTYRRDQCHIFFILIKLIDPHLCPYRKVLLILLLAGFPQVRISININNTLMYSSDGRLKSCLMNVLDKVNASAGQCSRSYFNLNFLVFSIRQISVLCTYIALT